MEHAVVNLSELQEFAADCAKNLHGGEVIALIGDLGAGKTTFTKALLKKVGIKKRITSPTFGIMAAYPLGKKTFYHVDLYRIQSIKEFQALGIAQTWQQPGAIYIIEWADKIARLLPKGTIIMNFSTVSEDTRKLSIRTK